MHPRPYARAAGALSLFVLLAAPTPVPARTGKPAVLTAAAPAPPIAERRPKVEILHGERRQDDYFWLREKTNPQVTAYLEAENAYAEQVMAPAKQLRESLYREMLARIKQTDLTVPFRIGKHLYYSRTEEGKQYPIHCRRKDAPGAAEEVLLDLNRMAEGHTFMAIGDQAVSDDGNLLAYTTDTTGFRVYTLHVKDLRTGEILPDTAEDVGSLAWAADNRTLFYTTKDAAKRPHRLWRHALGSARDDLVHEEKDEMFVVDVERTRSREYVLLSLESHTTSEVRCLPAARPDAAFTTIAERRHGREYDVDHRGDIFYIRVNDTGRNFRLVIAPVAGGGEAGWKEVVPHRPDVMLVGVDLFKDHMVAWERRGGLPEVHVTDLRAGASHAVAFPEPVYSVFPSNNHEWDTRLLRYSYQSLVTPASIFDYDMDARTAALLKQQEVLGGYDPARYESRRLHATAKDGTKVPVSLVFRKGLRQDGSAPLHLYGYGAYGSTVSAQFSPNRLSLLDRGFVAAMAHVRGGGEMGKPWHDQGRMMNKMNTFTDFIAVAEFLVAERYTSPDRLVIEGGSAGGLLMGAVANMRPDLLRAVVNHVPFVDVVNTMNDPSLPLTVGEFEEWGNPKNEAEYAYMRRYCPYSNIGAKAYPAMLVKTSLNDSQVMYWEPAKYVAKLRALKTDSNPLLLVTNMGAGHGGASGRYDRLREIALDYAFMLREVGIEE
jgi:oligopeptidase B